MRNYRSKLSKMLICFQKHATFRQSIPSQSAFYAATKTRHSLTSLASINKNAALSSRAQRILRQKTAINKTAFRPGKPSFCSKCYFQKLGPASCCESYAWQWRVIYTARQRQRVHSRPHFASSSQKHNHNCTQHAYTVYYGRPFPPFRQTSKQGVNM